MANFIFATGSKNALKLGASERRYAVVEPRVCVREEHIVHHAGGMVQSEWILHYSDGTEESVRGPWL